MAILNTLIDKASVSFAATSGGNGPFFQTLSHSLPATTADILLLQMVSNGAVGGNGVNHLPALLAFGQNASLTTVGYAIGSIATMATTMGTCYSIVAHSVIR